ncbi:MAG: hypothetical protein HYU47_00975 [Deltaproteobacteria bacterium]|nr:hypothetical protein [Deltaproteobacteria bacterium]
MLTKASGISTLDRWLAAKEPVKIGVTGAGSDTHYVPSILKAALGLPAQLVEGYKGTADIRLAADSREIQGGCWAWDVPNAIDYAKTDEARQLIQAGIHNTSAINRSFSLSPGTPKERVRVLQKAFMETMRDPEFLAEAQKSKLDINPISGDEVTKIVASFFELKPNIVAKLTDILVPKKK